MLAQPVCKGCGRPIYGHYLTALGATWHPEHFVCAACGRPITAASFQMHQGAPYHVECYNQRIAPRCAYCGKPLVGEYLVDHRGTRYCKEHQGQYPTCSFCGRLVPPHDQERGAESIRCAVCRSSAIEDAEVARPIFRSLIQWVGSQGLRYNNLPLTLELCGRAKLAQYLQEHNQTHSLGATMSSAYMQNGRLVRREITGVAVLIGLPETLFRGVTIHELGHVWLIVHGIVQLPTWAEEGFCELLTYRYYGSLQTAESRYHAEGIERNADPVYGEGFRRMRALAEKMGWSRFIETLQTTKRLPAHYP
ncbi:MAG TPA: protein DA1 [Ktedonobacteraceae bacterium]|nr:protein DA1 [Ktedonobacteraceae bacterium]